MATEQTITEKPQAQGEVQPTGEAPVQEPQSAAPVDGPADNGAAFGLDWALATFKSVPPRTPAERESMRDTVVSSMGGLDGEAVRRLPGYMTRQVDNAVYLSADYCGFLDSYSKVVEYRDALVEAQIGG